MWKKIDKAHKILIGKDILSKEERLNACKKPEKIGCGSGGMNHNNMFERVKNESA